MPSLTGALLGVPISPLSVCSFVRFLERLEHLTPVQALPESNRPSPIAGRDSQYRGGLSLRVISIEGLPSPMGQLVAAGPNLTGVPDLPARSSRAAVVALTFHGRDHCLSTLTAPWWGYLNLPDRLHEF